MMKKLGILITLAIATVFMPQSARALNLSEAILNETNHTEQIRRVVVTSTQVSTGFDYAALNLTYVGSSTESVVTISSAGGTFYAPGGVLDTSVGTGGIVFANSPVGTIGGFCDTVNQSVNYRCTMLDSRRSDPVSLLTDQTQTGSVPSTNLKGIGGYNVPLSTGSNTSTADTAQGPLTLGITPMQGKQVILKSCKFGVLTSNTLYSATFTVSGVNAKLEGDQSGRIYNDSTLVWAQAVSSVTEVTVMFYDPTGGAPGEGGLRFAHGKQTVNGPSGTPPGAANIGRVVVRVDPADRNAFPPPVSGSYAYGNTNQLAPSYLQCYWLEE